MRDRRKESDGCTDVVHVDTSHEHRDAEFKLGGGSERCWSTRKLGEDVTTPIPANPHRSFQARRSPRDSKNHLPVGVFLRRSPATSTPPTQKTNDKTTTERTNLAGHSLDVRVLLLPDDVVVVRDPPRQARRCLRVEVLVGGPGKGKLELEEGWEGGSRKEKKEVGWVGVDLDGGARVCWVAEFRWTRRVVGAACEKLLASRHASRTSEPQQRAPSAFSPWAAAARVCDR